MRYHHLIAFIFSLFSIIVFSQTSNSSINKGDIFVLGEVDNDKYEHIHFPKPNFIIKRGGIVNYDNVKGKKVEVTSIKENKDGSLVATIKLLSKKSFFGSHKYIKADIVKAVRQKELLRI